jgi:arylsulfatase A-like enzyme/cytochrome c-type biogenesis protein CcmH/NrfG
MVAGQQFALSISPAFERRQGLLPSARFPLAGGPPLSVKYRQRRRLMRMASLGSIGAAAMLFASTLGGAPPTGRVPDGPNILLITLDTTRADRLGCYGYAPAETPNLDGLAARGVRFASAYAPAPLTLPSHSSIMTGTYPLVHQVHDNGTYFLGSRIPTLADILRRRGIATAAVVSSFTLDSRFGIARGFDFYDDRFQTDEILKSFRSERKADAVFAVFSAWLKENARRRFFCWLHFYDPHLPYDPPSPFQERFRDRKYDGEIAYVDHVLGKVLDRLRDEGLRDNTLIVVTGDHGEGLGDKKEIDHGLFLYDGTMRVPLIISSGPGGLPPGAVVASRVRLIDIMPTILDLLGMPAPKGIQGVSLLPYIRGRAKADLPAYLETYFPRENYGWSELRGYIDGPWKFILAPRPELYDLAADPGEKNNVILEHEAVRAEESRKLEALVREFAPKESSGRRSMTAEEKEKLRSLGYLGGGADSKPGRTLPDPKDKIEDYLLYFRGNLLETQDRFANAAECYREVLRRNPDVPSNYVNLASLDMKMNRTEEALSILEQARSRFPDSVVILSRLMSLYIRTGRFEDALGAGRALLSVEPGNFDALFMSASAHAKLGQSEAALSCYQRALEIEPENDGLRRIWAETCYAYALVLGENGRLTDAVRWIKAYLESSPAEETPQREKARRLLLEWSKTRRISGP